MNKLLTIFYFVALAGSVTATDYCNKSLCGGTGGTHIGCNNNGEFDSSCPKDAEKRQMTESLQKLIIDAHNKNRNSIAGGGDEKLKPACRMATMEWDDELASLAELNVLQCAMKHDKCHNTDDFKYSGQNLAKIGFSGDVDDAARIEKSIELWYEEKKDVSQSIIDEYPKDYSGPNIGHFTVMVADRNIRVGCSAAIYSDNAHMSYLLACNYATTNMMGFPIYKSCDKPASKCESGTNSSYKNLCSAKESYNVNEFS